LGEFFTNSSGQPAQGELMSHVLILTKNGLGYILGDFFQKLIIFCNIFANFRRKNGVFSKTNVKITILHNLALF
jgi:hypothetical protein